METKSEIRKRILEQRKRLSKLQVSEKSRIICNGLRKQEQIAHANHILVYSSVQQEVDLSDLVEMLISEGKSVYFPKVVGDNMQFFEIKSYKELTKGSFGVLEPRGSSALWNGFLNSVILVPGVAFSETGVRIGYGKGFYDRFLYQYQKALHAIGVAYDFQVLSNLPEENFDYPIKCIITEKRGIIA